MSNKPIDDFDSARRRRGVRRTAWIVGGIAIALFIVTIAQAVLK